jgi:peptidoglycan hydrolase CwlO-like protein
MTNEEHIEDLHSQMATLQNEHNEAWKHVDNLQKHVEQLNDKVASLETALSVFTHLIADRLGIERTSH